MQTLLKKLPTTKEEARQQAIDWQNRASEERMSYAELAQWNAIWTKIAEEFDLVEEFEENGII